MLLLEKSLVGKKQSFPGAWRWLSKLLSTSPSAAATSCPRRGMARAGSMFNRAGKEAWERRWEPAPASAAGRELLGNRRRLQKSLRVQGGWCMRGFPSPFKATALQNGSELFQNSPQGDRSGTDACQGGPACSHHPVPAPWRASAGRRMGKIHVLWGASTSPGDLVWESLCR